jgi:hypothetical protein
LARPDHGVEDGQELSGAGGEGDLHGLSGGLEALAEGLEARVAAGCDEGGDIERAANLCAAAPDVAPAAREAAVAGVRREAGQCGDAAMIEAAKLGQASDERG